ncbi:hypothetical protein C7M84_021516 [Penaeus vannamei]|uniref:Uncharacterized protein n=1 Tax=Penaeus vannamei TaxID=6689 RepID=A0A3R7NKL7_PENVA|nr:hypothetical protein C7M84_021516 [Penaeus vannamei]
MGAMQVGCFNEKLLSSFILSPSLSFLSSTPLALPTSFSLFFPLFLPLPLSPSLTPLFLLHFSPRPFSSPTFLPVLHPLFPPSSFSSSFLPHSSPSFSLPLSSSPPPSLFSPPLISLPFSPLSLYSSSLIPLFLSPSLPPLSSSFILFPFLFSLTYLFLPLALPHFSPPASSFSLSLLLLLLSPPPSHPSPSFSLSSTLLPLPPSHMCLQGNTFYQPRVNCATSERCQGRVVVQDTPSCPTRSNRKNRNHGLLSSCTLQAKNAACEFLLFLLAGGGIVGPQLSNAECDPHCIPHRFTSVGIPLTHGTTKSFFWPEDDVMDIYVDGNGIKLTPDLEHLPRDRWHEVEMEVNLTDDKMLDITGRHGGGAFRLSSPSLSIDEWRSCEGRFWCPEFAECSHTTEQRCTPLQLVEFSLLLDRPQTVFWRPESLEKPRVIWGKRLEHSFELEVKEDLLFSWLRLEVVLVKGGTAGRSSCTLKVPG